MRNEAPLLKVAEMFGDFDDDLTLVASRWSKLVRKDNFDVIVVTAQLVLDALKHAFLEVEETNLIVFDEVHHATKMDAYARIMQNHYYHTPIESRPKIFGMTASPLKSDGDYQTAVANLENMMDAKVFTASLGLRRELEAVFKPAEEQVIEYAPAGQMKSGSLTRLVEEKCGHLEGVAKLLDRMTFSDREHGPLMSNLTWIGSSIEIKGRLLRKLEQANASAPDASLLSTDWIKKKALEMAKEKEEGINAAKKMKYVKDAIACSAVNEIVSAHPPIPDTLIVDASNATSKILTVIEVLKTYGSSPTLQRNFCCIMFVQRQKTAIALTELLKRVTDLKDWLRPEWLLGHNSDQGEGMDPKAQEQTLQRFGKVGSTNLLIATNVAEEGLDISPCNSVIRFDIFDHHAGYLQSKGRARSKHSRFLVLAEKGNSRHYDVIRKVVNTDKEIEGWLRRLPEDQGAIASMDLEEDDADDMDDYSCQLTITSPTTGACIRPIDCASLVCCYVDLLRRDEFSPQKPEFFQMGTEGSGFRTLIKFPANSKIRSVMGPVCSGKKKANRLACFEACRQLYELKELDEHLLPRRIKRLPTIRASLYLKSDKRKGESGNVNIVKRKTAGAYGAGIRTTIDKYKGEVTLHAILVHLEAAFVAEHSGRPVLLLFSCAIPALPRVELMMGSARIVPPTGDSVPIHLLEEQAKAACLYTSRIFSLLRRQDFVCDELPFLILPTVPMSPNAQYIDHNTIDWVEVHRSDETLSVKVNRFTLSEQETMKDCLVHEGNDVFSQRLYEVLSVRHEGLKALNVDGRQEREDVDADESKKEQLLSQIEPSFEVISILKQNNLLEAIQQMKSEKRTEKIRTVTSISKVACSASFYRSCWLLPSILYRYDQVFLARELNKELLDNAVEESRLVEALTTPEAQQTTHYQRLEFFGDCYLKLLACCWAFSKCDSHREGDLHLECAIKVRNDALLKIASQKKIAEYASSHTFTAKTWCPPLLIPYNKTEEGSDGDENACRNEVVMRLSDKTMADLVESILGAGLLSSSELDLSKASQCAKKLEILGQGVSTNLQDFQAMFRTLIQPKESAGAWESRVELGTLARLQEMLGYKFNSPHLALEAVTHCSIIEADLPSYERLEFLGDAVLDFLVVDLFSQKFKDLDEAGYTIIKQNATCNASLAVICIESEVQLYSFLLHGSAHVSESIATYKSELAVAKRESEEARQKGEADVPFWLELKPPKILADIVESMLGAIFVDSGFDLQAAKNFFNKFYKDHFETYFRPETSVVRSSWDFLQFVGSIDCTMWDLQIDEVDESNIYSCLVFHDVVIARRKCTGSKAKAIRETSKQDLDNIRGKGEVQPKTKAIDEIGAIKGIFQHCLPADYIRDSVKLKEVGSEGESEKEEDFKSRNRFISLLSICTCK